MRLTKILQGDYEEKYKSSYKLTDKSDLTVPMTFSKDIPDIECMFLERENRAEEESDGSDIRQV